MYLVVEKIFFTTCISEKPIWRFILYFVNKALINQENLWGQTSDAVKYSIQKGFRLRGSVSQMRVIWKGKHI